MCYIQEKRKNTAPHQEPTLEGPGAPIQPCYLQICGLRLLDGVEYIQVSAGEKGLTEIPFLLWRWIWALVRFVAFNYLLEYALTSSIKTGGQLPACCTPLGQYILCWLFLSQPLPPPPPPCHLNHWRGVSLSIFKPQRAEPDGALRRKSYGLGKPVSCFSLVQGCLCRCWHWMRLVCQVTWEFGSRQPA